MLIKTRQDIRSHEITERKVFENRRAIIKAMLLSTLASRIPSAFADPEAKRWSALEQGVHAAGLEPTVPEIVHNYTNYYEFAFNKEDSGQLAQSLDVDPWSIEISGEVEKPGKWLLEDIMASQTLREYIYRFRCVEAWSMVVPWVGFALADLLKLARPLSSAHYVKFTAVYRPEVMPKQRAQSMLAWPYVEGLRMDEAMHPLSIMAVGMYGDVLPKQNGAPLRLVVPWKYGFKSIKAVVKIELTRNPPLTSWNRFAPDEYGFYANVNPDVPHPRWSQRSERLLGSAFFTPRRKTELFNGYGDQVASLYSGMDLRRLF